MTSKKNMRTNRSPRRIHRNKGGRIKGNKHLKQLEKITKKNKDLFSYGAADDEFGIRNEDDYNREKRKNKDPMDLSYI